eukprot:2316295-Pyramimonas_sp.AAC.1
MDAGEFSHHFGPILTDEGFEAQGQLILRRSRGPLWRDQGGDAAASSSAPPAASAAALPTRTSPSRPSSPVAADASSDDEFYQAAS